MFGVYWLCVKFYACIVYRFDIASLRLSGLVCAVWLLYFVVYDYALLGFSVGDAFGL